MAADGVYFSFEDIINSAENCEQKRYKCTDCKKTFRGEEVYSAHLETETHKQNIKRVTIDTQEQNVASNFDRQKYKTRSADLNYKTYINYLTAYLSLRLALDQNVKDFKISVNDKEWQLFGDVVVDMIYKDKKVLYAIQCKKVTQDFRQIEKLEEANIHLTKQYEYLAQLRDKGRDMQNTTFIIFTTYSTGSNFVQSATLEPTVLNRWKTSGEETFSLATLTLTSGLKKNKIINVTDDSKNIYYFKLSDNPGYCLPHLFLYSSQRISPMMLNQLLKQKFDKYPDISLDYLKYIEQWADRKFPRGPNYKLLKKDVVLKIGEILLNPYIVPPKIIYSTHRTFTVWNKVIDSVDLIVMKNEPSAMSKVCWPINLMIEEILHTSIDTITKSIHLTYEILSKVKNPIKSYLNEVFQKQERQTPLDLVYNVFWKAGKIPLLMSSEGQEDVKGFILNVIMFMKQMEVHKKFLINTADNNLAPYNGSLKIFTCLDDVNDALDWNEVTIGVSDTFGLSLRTIQNSDPLFFKWVTPNIFFDICLGKYCFRSSSSQERDYNKDVVTMILSKEENDNLQKRLNPNTDVSKTDSNKWHRSRLRGIPPDIL